MKEAQDGLAQYGVLGLFTIIMLWVIWYFEKQRVAREKEVKAEKEELKERVAHLEERFENYQETDRTRLEALIEKNTDVLEKLVTKNL